MLKSTKRKGGQNKWMEGTKETEMWTAEGDRRGDGRGRREGDWKKRERDG